MSSNWSFLTMSFLYGACLGAFFFLGLHFTVTKGLRSRHSALWFFGSLMLRSAVVIGGFVLVAQRDPRWLVPSLLGFVLAREVTLRATSRCSVYREHPHAS